MDPDLTPAAPPRSNGAVAFLRNMAAGVRFAFFMRVPAGKLHASTGQFVAIAATSMMVSFAAAVALTGFPGTFDPQALPGEATWIPLALLAGYLSVVLTRDRQFALLVPVVIGSIGIVFSALSTAIWFAMSRGWLQLVVVQLKTLDVEPYPILFAWWALAVWLGVRRLTTHEGRHPLSPSWVVAIIVLVPAYLLPPSPLWVSEEGDEPATQAVFTEDSLYAQADLLSDAERRLQPERPGIDDLYFVGFAPYAAQDVFMKETRSIGKLMDERFDTAGRSIALISHPSTLASYPIATLTSLREVLLAVGERINPEEDVLMLHLTSHGSQTHELSVNFAPLDLQPIRPSDLRAALDQAGIKWRIIVVSACYSGGFIEALKDARTLVVTASDAKHTSFGCGNLFDFTYFSQAYYDEALRKTHNFEAAFALATESIRHREQKEGLEASNPQIYVGALMKDKLAHLQSRLDAATAHEK